MTVTQFDAHAQGKITADALAQMLRERTDLPVVLKIARAYGPETTIPLGEMTDVSIKSGQDTVYGDIDLVRVHLDMGDSNGLLLSHTLARRLGNSSRPVKIVRSYNETAFLVGWDLEMTVEEHDGEPVCIIRMHDADDA